EVLRRHDQEHDEPEPGQKCRAEIHEGERLAPRIVDERAARALAVFTVGEDAAEDGPFAAARAAHAQAAPEDGARFAQPPSRRARPFAVKSARPPAKRNATQKKSRIGGAS